MSEHTLTVKFRGICTHFRDVVPGVPHRTVFPDATPLRTGRVRIGHGPETNYTIAPHYLAIETKKALDIESFIEKGTVVRGVRLQIANAVPGLAYDDSFEDIPALTDYVPHYRPSTEVVHAGRAMAYFDLFSGDVSTEMQGQERHVVVTMRTHGRPVLQVTPLVVELPLAASAVWTRALHSSTLTFMNASRDCVKRSSLDFLLNFLTGEGGIPHAVTADFPLGPWEPEDAPRGEAQSSVSEDDLVPPTAEELFNCVNEGELPMCSDTRYP